MNIDKAFYEKALKEALLEHPEASGEGLSMEEAEAVSKAICDNVDLNNPIIGHKGFRWMAKEFYSSKKRLS